MAEDWLEDVKKYATNVDEAAVAGIVRYCGIALRNRDSSLVSFSDPTETDRVRENFLKKKLALTDPDSTLDGAIAAVGDRMKEDRTKNRVTVYYLLAEHFHKLGLFNGGGAATGATPASGDDGVSGTTVAGVAAAGAAGLAALGGATEAAASGVNTGGTTASGAGMGGTSSGIGSDSGGFGDGAGGARSLADLPDDDGGSIFSKWWLWLLLALAILAAFLLLKSCTQPATPPVAGNMADTTLDSNLIDDQTSNVSGGDISNTVTALPATPAAPAPAGAGLVSETKAGLPVLTAYFDTGKADLASGFADKVADVKAYVAAHPGAKLAVSGYNDSTGNAAVNAELSKKRAQAVAAALKTAGIAEDAVVLEKPADTTIANTDPAAARRVEVTVKQ